MECPIFVKCKSVLVTIRTLTVDGMQMQQQKLVNGIHS